MRERISEAATGARASFNFRQRRKDIDPATAPANEVVAGGSAREVTINY